MAQGITRKITFLILVVAACGNAGAQTTVTNSLKLRIHVDEPEVVKEYEFNLSPGVSAGVISPQTGEFYTNSELLSPNPDEFTGQQTVVPK